jgi:serine dehydrogenase proteinase
MSWNERIALYQKIENHRKRPLIVYVTSKREGVYAIMSTDALPKIIEQIDALPAGSEAVDFLIASHGGDPMVAWRIMTLIRQRVKNVAVMIPQSAYSAATLVAFGADEIIMHPNGHLGPVDMQITTIGDSGQAKRFSTEDISAFLEFVRDNLKITDQEHIRILFELTCKEVGSLVIGFSARSSKLAVDLGERLLALHMADDENRSKLRSIVENMSRKFQSHAYPVNRKEAVEMGLPVNKERDHDLEKLMWSAWLSLEQDLKESTPFDPIFELLKSSEASKLMAPVPQIAIPEYADATTHWNTSLADLNAAIQVTVDPVDFDYTTAMVESCRIAYSNVTRGKILACRNPDLMIRFNRVVTSREWEKAQKQQEGKVQ